MNRREFVLNATGSLLALSAALGPMAALAQEAEASEPQSAEFSFDILTDRMRALAAESYSEPNAVLPDALTGLDYDLHRAIRYRPDRALWNESPFQLQAFHLGWLFDVPVRVHEIVEGQATEIRFSGADFEYREPLDASAFADVEMPGIAGFRLHNPLNRADVYDELVTFLGASYFRALGQGSIYGLSARRLAVDTATNSGEEFPRFSDFYIERPSGDATSVTIYAAMDSRRVTGAYAFTIEPGATTRMEVTARLFLRDAIGRIGIAPMTSMFLFAENNRDAFDDYRNQVHDSEGLKIVRASGEEVWRTLNNPPRLALSLFGEQSPRAFGLFQRDRAFENYQDAEAFYERRPSLLVEPIGDWGRGSIMLVEIPTDLEVNDNIVAFWVPEGETSAGQEMEYSYRLTWGDVDETAGRARVVAVRGGHGGTSGVDLADNAGTRKFVVDFEGGPLARLGSADEVAAELRVTNAQIVHSAVSRLDANGRWRLVMDIAQATDPVEFEAYLVHADARISETWAYQWKP
jgi:glucans biosynthesis protein